MDDAKSSFFLSMEFLRLPNFAFFKGSDDAQISQKHEKLFPLVADIFDLNKFA